MQAHEKVCGENENKKMTIASFFVVEGGIYKTASQEWQDRTSGYHFYIKQRY